jgi:cation diffusion facilitator family transporter
MTQKHFPAEVPLPSKVAKSRAERESSLLRSATYGILIRSAIIVFEFFGVWLYGSAALLLDAVASLVDVASSLLLLLFIKLASRPPDYNHPFGHGRYEPLVGLQLGLLLIGIGIFSAVQQIFLASETTSEDIRIDARAWLIPLTAMALLEFCYRLLIRTARKQESPALAADAVHYRVDAMTSLFAAIALLLAAFKPDWSHLIDHLGAVAIAIFMVVLGVKAAYENVHQLLDRAPDQSYFDRVKESSFKVKGVRGTEKIRIQQYGPDAHIDIDIEVDPNLSVEVAHKISQKVRVEIQKDWPSVRDVTVHIEPFYPNDH